MSENTGILQVPIVGKNSENISNDSQKLVYVHIPKDKDAALPTTFTLTKTAKLSGGNSITFSQKSTVMNSSTSKARPPILGNKISMTPSLNKSSSSHVPITSSKQPIKVAMNSSNLGFGSTTPTIFRTNMTSSSTNLNFVNQGSGSCQTVTANSVYSPSQIRNSTIISQMQSKSPKPVFVKSNILSSQRSSPKFLSKKILPMPHPAKQGMKNSTVLSYGAILPSGVNSPSDSSSPLGVKRDAFGIPKNAFTPPPIILQSGSNAKKLGTKSSGPTTISFVTGKSSNTGNSFSLYPLSRSGKPSSMMNFKFSNGQLESGTGKRFRSNASMKTQLNSTEEGAGNPGQDLSKPFQKIKSSLSKQIEQKDILQEAMSAMVSDSSDEGFSSSIDVSQARSNSIPVTASVTQVPQVPDTAPVPGLNSSFSKVPQAIHESIPILVPKNVAPGCSAPILLQGTLPVVPASSPVPVAVHKVKLSHPSNGSGILQSSSDVPGLIIRTDALTVRRKFPGKEEERKEPAKPDLSIIPILRNSSQDKILNIPKLSKSSRLTLTPERSDPSHSKPNENNPVTRLENEVNKSLLSSKLSEEENVSPEPKDLLKWENGMGSLLGSELKFTLNEFDAVELIEDNALDEIKNQIILLAKTKEQCEVLSESVSQSQADTQAEFTPKPVPAPVHIHHARKPNLNRKDDDIAESETNSDPTSKMSRDMYDICCCKNCGCYGLSSEFFIANGNSFCTGACSEDYSTKEAEWNREKQRMEKSKNRLKKNKSTELKDTPEKIEVKSKDVKEVLSIEQKDIKQEEKEITLPPLSIEEVTQPPPLPSPPTSLPQIKEEVTLSQDIPKFHHSWQDTKSLAFSWVKYLEHCMKNKGAANGIPKGAPLRLWTEPFPFGKNLFRTGMKLEGIDPQHQCLFCVMTVVDVVGYRIRLHFDGYSDMYDFWCNANSPNIFQVGWCEKNGKTLETPPGIYNFTWKAYLEHCGALAAPKHAFTTSTSSTTNSSLSAFRIGNKLEAEDRKNGWICVASVADVLDNRILVHFDGWDKAFDTWFDITSPYIHPVGWCSKNGAYLYPPKDYSNPDSFLWHEYLQETNSVGVPARAFKVRSPKEFKMDMKLEAVDKRNPMLIRVATVVEVKSYKLLLRFDGWPDMYDCSVDDDSLDIHPPTWCSKTGHILQPPLTPEQCAEDVDSGVGCGTQGCKGYGHVKGLIYITHHTAYGCPYSLQNLNKDWEALLPDRLESPKEKKKGKLPKNYINLDESKPIRDENEDSHRKRVRKRRKFFDELSPPEGANKTKIVKMSSDEYSTSSSKNQVLIKSSTPTHSSSICQSTSSSSISTSANDCGISSKKSTSSATTEEGSVDTLVHQSIFNPGYHPNPPQPIPHSLERHKHIITSINLNQRSDVDNWGPKDVCNAISKIPGCELSSLKFLDQDVDGESLLMLTQNDLIDLLGLKLGPAIKITSFIFSLKNMP